MYNDYWVTSEAICQWFSRVMKSRVKIIGKSHREWPKKSLFTVTNVLFYFLHAILCPGSHNSAKNHHRSLISQLSPRTAFSDFTLWRHHCWSVTSREREILALWRHICRLSLPLTWQLWHACEKQYLTHHILILSNVIIMSKNGSLYKESPSAINQNNDHREMRTSYNQTMLSCWREWFI